MLTPQTMNHFGGWRLLNASGATLFSICGLLLFMHYAPYLGSFFDYSRGMRYFLVYNVMRLFLALAQIPLHMGVLFSARFFTEPADKLIKFVGKGNLDQGTDKYYELLDKCNLGICVFIVLSGLAFGLGGSFRDVTFYVLEGTSLTILVSYLVARIYGKIRKMTREMFYVPSSDRTFV